MNLTKDIEYLEQDKCIFLINTEYVLLISLLYTKYILHPEILPVFVLIKNSERRFSGINQQQIPGKVFIYDNEIHTNKIFPEKSFLEVTNLRNVKQIHFQNPQDMINSSLVSYFYQKIPDIKITLVSDSIAIDREILTKTRDRIIHYVRLFFRKYINQVPNISWSVWSYHKMPFVPDELIAHRNFGYEKFFNTKDLFSKISDSFDLLSGVFKINNHKFEKASILIFTQPNLNYSTYSTEVKKGYIEGIRFLSGLAKKYKKHCIIKVHPAEDPNVYKPFTHEYVILDQNPGTPAEIIINGLENKKIVSYWSSISVYDIFNKHKHYWLYKTIGYELPKSHVPSIITVLQNEKEIENILFKNS